MCLKNLVYWVLHYLTMQIHRRLSLFLQKMMYFQVYQKQLESNYMVPLPPPNIKSEMLSVEDRQVYLVKMPCSYIARTAN